MTASQTDEAPRRRGRRIPCSVPLLIAAFALVVVAAGATVFMVLRASAFDALVTHSFQVRQVAMSLLSNMQDLETGQRGYLLTADDAYLDPFNRAVDAIPRVSARLQELVADNPEQTKRVAALLPLIDGRRDIAAETIAQARRGERTQALDLVKASRGKALMDQFRDGISSLSDDERTLLLARQDEAARARNLLLALVCSSLLAAIALAGFLAHTANGAIAEARARATELEAEVKLRRETEDTLRQAQKIEAVGQLTGGIAHDFNNLLTIIIGNLDTLRRRTTEIATSADARTFAASLARPIEFATRGAQSAAQLTHRLLAFSRRQALEPARLDVNRLIGGMSDLLRRTLGETISVETALSGGLWPTFADANQLENALLNLCVNARDAMPSGGRLTIETANAHLDEAYVRQFADVAVGQYVLLSVADTGTGIPPEFLERAFEPFFTTKPAGQGSGLGLAMVHGFVKQSGGHIRIYSEVGHGTTVKIYLPRLMREEVAAAPLAKPAVETSPRSTGAETILLVEDNDGVREFAAAALLDLGYAVLEGPDGEAALRIIDGASRIDLLFTDVVLPGMSGRELANLALVRRPGLPVLFTTGYTRNAIIHHGLDPGVQLLGKPYAQRDLALKIREILDGAGKTAGARP